MWKALLNTGIIKPIIISTLNFLSFINMALQIFIKHGGQVLGGLLGYVTQMTFVLRRKPSNTHKDYPSDQIELTS